MADSALVFGASDGLSLPSVPASGSSPKPSSKGVGKAPFRVVPGNGGVWHVYSDHRVFVKGGGSGGGGGAAPGQPYDWLAPLSPQQVQQRAAQLVSSSYGPAYEGYNTERQQLQAISDKRNSDNQYYNQWLGEQQAKLQASAQQFDTQAQGASAGATASVAASYPAVQSALQASAASKPGSVSDQSQNTQVGGILAANAGRDNATAAAQQTMTSQMLSNNENARAATYANNLANVAANEAKQASDTWQALAGIASKEQATRLQQAADTAKEVETLISQEVNKANANRNYSAAVAKLGISQQTANATTSRAATAAKGQAATAKHLVNADQVARQRAAIDQQRADAQAKHQQNQDWLAWYKTQHPTSVSKSASLVNDSSLNNAYNALTNRTAQNDLLKAGAGRYDSVKNNPAAYVAALVKVKIPQVVAQAAVEAYIKSGGKKNINAATIDGPAVRQYIAQRH